ncbi:MAG: PAS domain S-box protein, partial [Campylobacterota bacterium]|nr:PAS domain S-box protein [Campylobacterota bacterium]
KKYAKNITFDYNHKGINGKIPFPSTAIHELSQQYSKKGHLKFKLYSNYPFANRKDRVLNDFEKKALIEVEKSKGGIYYQKDTLNGKEVLRVAVADVMSLDACVKCHNTHPLKTWGDKQWKIGDKRGVIEVITPIDDILGEMHKTRDNITASVIIIIVILFGYYMFIILVRERQLRQEKQEVLEDYQHLFNDFDKHVIVSQTDLDGTITYVSSRLCEMFGYSKEEIMGQNHTAFRHPDTPSEVFEEMWEKLNSNQTWEGDLQNLTRDGQTIWSSVVISPLYDHDKKKIGYSSIRHNISYQKQLEAEHAALKEQMAADVYVI